MSFRLLATCPSTSARAGVISTAHGELPTPAFMPVGTVATVKGLTPADLGRTGARCVLANTYHLALRPGADLVASQGGLHHFMAWNGPILTDSGGFQVFSLSRLRETDESGVRFCSHLDGRRFELTPESAIGLQNALGADLIMPLDVCLGPEASESETVDGLERTRRWAIRSREAHSREQQKLFGIVQGGLNSLLRKEAARDLGSLGFEGYAIGGLSVGEPRAVTEQLVGETASELPTDRPRYLMGVGTPEQIRAYSALGIDIFDCVLPTRFGRTGTAFGATRRLNLRRGEFERDDRPIDSSCDCVACERFGRAFLHAGVRSALPLAARLISIHNVRALVRTAESVRHSILERNSAQHSQRQDCDAPRWPEGPQWSEELGKASGRPKGSA